MTSLHAINDLRTELERLINESLRLMPTADADTRFRLRTEMEALIWVANKIAIVQHTIVDKVKASATDAAVGKEAHVYLRHTHKYSSYIPEVDDEEMLYILRKRLQHLVRYELELARKWVVTFNLPTRVQDCMEVVDKYMLFAEKLGLLSEYDIEHTRKVQNACLAGNFSLNTIKYHLDGE
jgi:hypothetical protein